MEYDVLAYAMTCTLWWRTLWCHSSRFSPCGDSPLRVKIQKLCLSSPLCAAPVDLLNPLTCRSSTVWFGWQKLQLFSLFLCWSSARSSSHVTHDIVLWDNFFVLRETLLRIWYFLPVIWLSNCCLSPFLDSTYVCCYINFVVGGVGWRGRCGQSWEDQKDPQFVWSSIRYQGWVADGFASAFGSMRDGQVIFVRLVSPGWYAVTRGTWCGCCRGREAHSQLSYGSEVHW